MGTVFRFAALEDQAALVDLLIEVDRHYWGPHVGENVKAQSTADALVNGRSGCRAVVADLDGSLVGLATISVLHPSLNEHGTLFMKDLFVSSRGRGKGIGALFMRHLAKLTIELGCRRFDWTAESDNPRAIEFYDQLGAERVEEKVYFRFRDADLSAFAASIPAVKDV